MGVSRGTVSRAWGPRTLRTTGAGTAPAILVLAVLIVATLAAGCGDSSSETSPSPTPVMPAGSPNVPVTSSEDMQLFDDVLTAWNDNDVAAVTKLYSTDARLIVPGVGAFEGSAEIGQTVAAWTTTVERVGDVFTSVEPVGGDQPSVQGALPRGSDRDPR
jgi:hypothetical protein